MFKCGVWLRRHNTKQQQRKKLPKGAMLNPRHAQSPAPNSSRSPTRDEESATLPNRRESDRMWPETHETAARTQFSGPSLCLALCHLQCCFGQSAQKRFFPQFPWGFCLTRSNFATRRVRSPKKLATPQGERLFPRQPTRDRRENAPKK